MGWIGSAIYCPENLSCMKFIETHACAFLAPIITSISSVHLAGFEDTFSSSSLRNKIVGQCQPSKMSVKTSKESPHFEETACLDLITQFLNVQ